MTEPKTTPPETTPPETTPPETTPPETTPPEVTTAWHPMLVALLEIYLPTGWQLTPEFMLNRMPLRVDMVILRRVAEPVGAARKLHSIFDHLRPHTLIEHKGPTDELAREDVPVLLAYGAQYMRLAGVLEPDDLCLMVVCDRISGSFVDQVKRHEGSFAPIGEGLWRGRLAGLPLHGVETREACRANPTERLLYAFSRAYLTDPAGLLPLDPEEVRVYTELYQQVEQFRKRRGAMAMKDYERAHQSYEEILEQLLEQLPPEKRLAGLGPAERLAGLGPAERLAGLGPEERLAGLGVDEILRGIPPELRAQLAKKLAE
ncbi:MAG TPA: hypothetical protein VLS89_04870 [Candidatus Nanopelagicales bacterium]|nr:hypothetical protein [Candidatus Nanopelagicales bacterium]